MDHMNHERQFFASLKPGPTKIHSKTIGPGKEEIETIDLRSTEFTGIR